MNRQQNVVQEEHSQSGMLQNWKLFGYYVSAQKISGFRAFQMSGFGFPWPEKSMQIFQNLKNSEV